jgi:hypothetical protein
LTVYRRYELLIIDSHIIYEDINYWQSLNIWIIIFMNIYIIYELLIIFMNRHIIYELLIIDSHIIYE